MFTAKIIISLLPLTSLAHISANVKREYDITYITTTTTSVTINVKHVKELSSRSHQGAHIKVLISSQQDVLNLALRI